MSLFDQNAQTPAVDENVDYYEQYVGEGKKFKDERALARAKAESDAFIARLQQEAEGLRTELNQRTRLSELVDRLQAKDTPQQEQQRQEEPTPNADTPTAPQDLNKLVEDLITQREKRATAEQNVNSVKKTLTEKYGAGYADKLKAQADQLGVSPQWLTTVAEQSPTAFYNLIGLNQSAPSTPGFTPPQSSQRPSAFEPANSVKNMAYYDKIKAKSPSLYWDPKTQNEMHKNAIALGEKFFT